MKCLLVDAVNERDDRIQIENKDGSFGVNVGNRISNLMNWVDFAIWDIKLLYWFSEFDR
jgi:hypothetical protein